MDLWYAGTYIFLSIVNTVFSCFICRTILLIFASCFILVQDDGTDEIKEAAPKPDNNEWAAVKTGEISLGLKNAML